MEAKMKVASAQGYSGPKKVLVFGTFDGLHEGHKNLLMQAREFGDYVIAVIARDSTVLQNKGRAPKYTEEERKRGVEESGLANEAVLGQENHNTEKDQYELIREIKPDVVCLGYDQAKFEGRLKEELARMNLQSVQIQILKPFNPEQYKSSIINSNLKNQNSK